MSYVVLNKTEPVTNTDQRNEDNKRAAYVILGDSECNLRPGLQMLLLLQCTLVCCVLIVYCLVYHTECSRVFLECTCDDFKI